MTTRWAWLHGPIATEAEADAFLAELGKGLYAIAALQVFFGFLAGLPGASFIGDVVFCVVVGRFLPRTRSRLLAIVLLIWALATAGITAASMVGAARGGRNVILAALIVLMAARSVYATARYHKLVGTQISWKNVAVVGTVQIVGAALIFVGTAVAAGMLEYAIGRSWSDETLSGWAMLAVLFGALLIRAATRKRFPLMIGRS